MKGSDFFTACTSLINGFSIDSTLFYQLLNTARIRRELSRPFKKLQKYDFTQSIAAQSFSLVVPPSAKATIPSDFLYLSRDGEITLYDNNGQWEDFTEIPIQAVPQYLRINNVFYADHGAGFFYFMGNIQKTYTAFIPYQANLGDIAVGTSWINIPSIFHMILAYDVAAMYRLGMDYDDINARNADQNARDADRLYNAMVQWDDNLARSATARVDYPLISGEQNANFNRKISID